MSRLPIPPSTNFGGPSKVPEVKASKEEILSRPFSLHEAASLVAEEDEWERYMVVGRERGLLEALDPQLAAGTRFGMRRDLEATFWGRILENVIRGIWRAVRVTDHEETSLGPYQVTALSNPFELVIAGALSSEPPAERLVFQAINQKVTRSERRRREQEAADYIRAWAGDRRRIPVDLIDEEIARQFPHYNFGPTATTRIRKAAGLKQARGNYSRDI
jgi:hypothetical protein